MKTQQKNDIVKNLTTNITKNKISISLFSPVGLGYDGCGTHTHGYASTARIDSQKKKA